MARAETATKGSEPSEKFQLAPAQRRVFVGLMLGMFVASVSQTIVGPAMPRIVAELGGIDHYSWVATAAMLVSAITVPTVGKLSDIYGRRPFYLAGILIFLVGSLVCGLAQNFWVLVAGRAIQGMGMGTLMPLSQTIIGDIVPARFRGKYQGLMGAVFGVTSVAGPIAGGAITDQFGWRWLFYATLPIGLVAFFFIMRFLHLDHEPRAAKIDKAGIVTLSVGLVCVLLATSWGGTTYPWGSPVILGLYVVGFAVLVGFVMIERRAEEPVIPLRLFGNSIFAWSNVGNFTVSMLMFGSIIYIPIYAQGVIGVNATNSGLILMPLMLGFIVLGIGTGMMITRTGRYKEFMLAGVAVLGVGVWLLTRLRYGSTAGELTVAMVVIGVGLGLVVQQYTLVIQNATARRDLGVATASSQFFRNVGSTVGIAIFGSAMTAGLTGAIARYLPPGAAESMPEGATGAGAVLDPAALEDLPAPVVEAVRHGLADQMHIVFLIGIPIVIAAFIATLMIRVIPLRETIAEPEEQPGGEIDSLAQTARSTRGLVPGLASGDPGERTRERLLGLQFRRLAERAKQDGYPLLHAAVTQLGDGDFARGVALLERTAAMLTTSDPDVMAEQERFAVEVAHRAGDGILSPELRQELAVRASEGHSGVLDEIEPTVADRYEAVDLEKLRQASSELVATLLIDVATPALESPRRK